MIDNLLAERKEVLILYSRVAGLQPFDEEDDDSNVLRQFIQLLVDYIAAAHFGLYERIVSGKERRQGVVKLAEQLYPRIAECTDVVVAFNDRYDAADAVAAGDGLSRDLSRLGEHLAERIELEDKLIAELL
jgi:regulator of sigma D